MGGFHHANTPHATPLSQNLSKTLCRNNKNSPFSVEKLNIKATQNSIFQPDVVQVYL